MDIPVAGYCPCCGFNECLWDDPVEEAVNCDVCGCVIAA